MGREAPSQLVLLRFSGDIGTKAQRTRSQFVGRMLQNLRDALVSEGQRPVIQISRDRVFVELPRGASTDALTRVFGVQSVSTVERRPPGSAEQIAAAGEPLFREALRGRRFAVRARWVGHRPRGGVRSGEVERQLGAALLPGSAGVDLEQPERTAHVELTEKATFFFLERQPGPGGLPLGVEGRALALLSGGFDSAVAAWQLGRRGVAVDYLFCNLGGTAHLRGVLKVASLLAERWGYGTRPRLYEVDFEALAAALRERTQRRYWQVLLKRLMLRAAERIACERRAEALITGDAVGQVSSQTLTNLASISEVTSLPVLRPLVGLNKEEIIELAGRIGTFEASKVVGEYCALVPSRPATRASPEVLRREEAALNPALLERAVAARRRFDLRGLDPELLGPSELRIDHVPPGSVVLDLRARAEFGEWHWPEALWLDFAQALRAYPSFDRDATYVLYCDLGLKSAHLAERMRAAGFRAFHFRGGTRALRRLA